MITRYRCKECGRKYEFASERKEPKCFCGETLEFEAYTQDLRKEREKHHFKEL